MQKPAKSQRLDADASVQLVKQAIALKCKYAHPEFPGLTPLLPGQVGVDWENRGASGLQVIRVHSLFSAILDIGCDGDMNMGGALLPDCKDRKTYKHNLEFCKGEAGFPPVQEIMAYGSLEHGHYNYILRCIAGAAESEDPRVTTNGKIDIEKVRGLEPAFATQAATGLKWLVLDPRMRDEEPRAAGIIAEAANAKQSLGMNKNDAEMIESLRTACMASQRLGVQIDRIAVLRQAMAAKSHSLEEAAGFLDYVRVTADSDVDYIGDLKRFIRTHVNSKTKFVRGSYYSACSSNVPEGCNFLLNGLIQGQYLCLPGQVQPDGACESISLGAVKGLKKNADKAIACNEALKKHYFLDTESLSKDFPEPERTETKRNAVLVQLYTMVARFATEQPLTPEHSFETLNEVLDYVLKPTLRKNALAKAPAKKEETFQMVTLRNAGQMVDVMQRATSMGYKIGVGLKAKESEVPEASHRLIKISPDAKAQIEELKTAALLSIALSDVMEKWIVLPVPTVATEGHVRLWAEGSSANSMQWKIGVTKSLLLLSLDMLAARLAVGFEGSDLLIKTKPRGGVFANKRFGKDKLRLGPQSLTIMEHCEDTAEKPKVVSHSIELIVDPAVPKYHFYLVPVPVQEGMVVEAKRLEKKQLPLVSPYWQVRKVPHAREANCKIVLVKMELLGAVDIPCMDGRADRRSVSIPIIVNKEVIAVGDELTVAQG